MSDGIFHERKRRSTAVYSLSNAQFSAHTSFTTILRGYTVFSISISRQYALVGLPLLSVWYTIAPNFRNCDKSVIVRKTSFLRTPVRLAVARVLRSEERRVGKGEWSSKVQ